MALDMISPTGFNIFFGVCVGLIALFSLAMMIRPELYIRVQVWAFRVMMGAKFVPTDWTKRYVQILGLLMFLFSIGVGALFIYALYTGA